ncbi:universal stress protein [Kineococcus sp. SYSU DK003]|uniref:universal stress protein n=1 Tax=Kineococcus sp. SYSU DK003 TaxID=3383124 RepID=UPI003D7CA3A2
MGTIVVGLDTLDDCRAAVEWAADAADRSEADLEIVRGVRFPPAVDTWNAGYVPEVLEQLDQVCWDELARARDLVRHRVHGNVRTTLVHDHARPALLAAATRADLLVTGARHRNRLRCSVFGGFQLGSTSLFAAAHALCPVVVVRGAATRGARDLVVGFDGSPSSTAAACWALAQAAVTGARVHVVLVRRAVADLTLGLDPTAAVASRGDDEAAAHARLEDVVQRLQRSDPRVEVDGTVVRHDHPEDVLLEAAGTCALLVVGSRGHAAFTSALIGSTSHAVLHHALTPVVVVPDAAQVAHRRRAVQATLARR